MSDVLELRAKSDRRFSKTERLCGSADFGRTLKSRHRWGGRHFSVVATISPQPFPRLGVAVGKKYVRKATQRNRIKRLIREAFRSSKEVLFGLDIVVLVKRAPEAVSNQALATDLGSLLHIVGQWQRASSSVSSACTS